MILGIIVYLIGSVCSFLLARNILQSDLKVVQDDAIGLVYALASIWSWVAVIGLLIVKAAIIQMKKRL